MLNRTKPAHAALVAFLVIAMALGALVTIVPTTRANHDTVPWVTFGDISSNPGFDRGTPAMVAGRDGALFEFYYTRSVSTGWANINVSKATEGGFLGFPTFNFDTQVNDAGNRNFVSTSSPLSATIDHSGNLYVAWTRIPVGASREEVYVSKSPDGGRTWQAAVPVRAGNMNHRDLWPSIGVSPSGTVHVAWIQVFGPFLNITVSQSTDGGVTFTAPTNVSGQGPRGLAVYPSLTVDALGRTYVAYTGFSATYYSTNLTWSDTGASWSPPVQLTPTSTYALYPQIVADASGRVHLVWLDYRGLSSVGAPQFFYTQTTNGGATWTTPLPITQGTVPPGNFASISVHANTVMVAFPGGGEIGYVLSADGGTTWYHEASTFPGFPTDWVSISAGSNDTFFAGLTDTSGATSAAALAIWNGPPSTPAGVTVTAGPTALTVSWTASPEPNVVEYQVWRSTDQGQSYQLIASVPAGTTSYLDGSLANGTYWYRVDAVNVQGTPSHPSAGVSGVVGPTTAQLIAGLQSQIAALQNELAQANASTAAQLAALQSQISALKNQITALQNSQAANDAATAAELNRLQANLTNLQNQLNDLKGQAATQTLSYANLAFEVIVVVLLVVLLLNQMRRPKQPQMMMAQPGQAAPSRRPEDEL